MLMAVGGWQRHLTAETGIRKEVGSDLMNAQSRAYQPISVPKHPSPNVQNWSCRERARSSE